MPKWNVDSTAKGGTWYVLPVSFKTSGIRIGSAAITARGFGEEESRQVAELIIKTLKNAENESVLEEVRSAVKSLTDAFPLYED